MAICHAQPLLLSLLVSLFFLPAAFGATNPRQCTIALHPPVEVKTVTISPKPPGVMTSTNANMTIIGDTRIELSDGATVYFRVKPKGSAKRSYSLCDLVACPVAPGPIEFTLTNVFTEEELDVHDYRTYNVRISIKRTAEDKKEPIMCVTFFMGVRRDEVFLPRQATE